MRRFAIGLGLVGLLCAGGLVGLHVHRAAEAERLQRELQRAEAELAAGRVWSARKLLADLQTRHPTHDDVLLVLGECEQTLGRPAQALELWGQVAAGSRRAGEAAVLRSRLLLRAGFWSDAEALLLSSRVVEQQGPHALEACHQLATLDKLQGRWGEAAQLYQTHFERIGRPVVMLRELWRIRRRDVAVDQLGEVVRQTSREAADDDRVWLANAAVHLREGNPTAAWAWLDRCLERRPNDPAVWKAVLTTAMAADDPGRVQEAIGRLPAEQFAAVDRLDVAAWTARRAQDDLRERRFLERILEWDPTRTRDLERLVELAIQAGDLALATDLRLRRAALDHQLQRYELLIFSQEPESHSAELAGLASSLGWHFEADAWRKLAGETEPPSSSGVPHIKVRSTGAVPTVAELIAGLEKLATTSSSDHRMTGVTPPRFRDVAESVGIHFAYESGRLTPDRSPPEMMGGGVGVLDYDGDGWIDVYCVQGGPFPPDPAEPPFKGGDRLFRNRRDGTFEDVTEAAGIVPPTGSYGHGVATDDFDNDGHPDILVTRWRRITLYRNRGDGTFEDVTELSGLSGDQGWPTSAAFADLDGDADPDLYVAQYLAFHPDEPLEIRAGADTSSVDYSPLRFAALPDRLFRNDSGRFVEVAAEVGIVDEDGRGLGVVAADLDGDGHVDLYVANDLTANALYRNLGQLRFEEVGHLAGIAGDAGGGYQAGMGIAFGDADNDGQPDLAVTNFAGEGTTFYRNQGRGFFVDDSARAGVLAASRTLLGFGAAFLDYDNDGILDLATANGHVSDVRPAAPFAMPAQLLAGVGDGRFVEVSRREGSEWTLPRVGRGLAIADLNNDGRLDVLILAHDAPLAVFRNETDAGHFVSLTLQGTRSPKTGVGARVVVVADGRRQVGWRVGGGSFQSASDPRVHFGLGTAELVDAVEVFWPSGQIDRHERLPVDTRYLLIEGDPASHALP